MNQIADLYRIRHWAGGFFDVNNNGEIIAVLKDGDGDEARVSLLEIIKELSRLGLSLPAILRFPDILAERVRLLNGAFREAIEKSNYQSNYAGCFPIKVNQKREVISEITSLSPDYHFGFEAGTKAELIAAIAHLRDREAHLVCNGYKDETFVDLALYARKAGLNVVLVIERESELKLILRRAARLGVEPRLGLRGRIQSSGAGRWSSTSGGQGLFGLSPLELIRAVDHLRSEGLLDCLYMLHFHQGSQIPDINTIRRGLEEACNLYVELIGEGARLGAINIGGGLAIDYEGSGLISNSSKNYSLSEYCETVVEVIGEYMDLNELPHPVIISESGRAIASHYSALVFNILDGAETPKVEAFPPDPDAPAELHRLYKILEAVTTENARDSITAADALIHKCRLTFAAGQYTLREVAAVEKYRECLNEKIGKMLAAEDLQVNYLGPQLAEYYYANFSVFQSLPDAWAISQMFPILPIHRLNEKPTREGIVADITCDCDGKIKRYIGAHDESSTLPLHSVKSGEPYYLGAFLVGAYQETLGDIHNLLGQPAVVSVRVQEGEFHFERIDEGETISGVLRQVDFKETDLFDGLNDLADEAHSEGLISGGDRNSMVHLFGETLKSTTYLNPHGGESEVEDELPGNSAPAPAPVQDLGIEMTK